MKPKSILTAASILIWCSACAQTDLNRIRGAGATAGGVRAANRVVPYPDDCRRVSRSGVTAGDRLDIALLKTDAALSRQNARTLRCADWYERAIAPHPE